MNPPQQASPTSDPASDAGYLTGYLQPYAKSLYTLVCKPGHLRCTRHSSSSPHWTLHQGTSSDDPCGAGTATAPPSRSSNHTLCPQGPSALATSVAQRVAPSPRASWTRTCAWGRQLSPRAGWVSAGRLGAAPTAYRRFLHVHNMLTLGGWVSARRLGPAPTAYKWHLRTSITCIRHTP